VPRDIAEDQLHQVGWRRCAKCAAMFWVDPQRPVADTGRCPGGGFHVVTAGVNLSPRHAWREEDHQNQRWWRFCVKCHGLFFNRFLRLAFRRWLLRLSTEEAFEDHGQ